MRRACIFLAIIAFSHVLAAQESADIEALKQLVRDQQALIQDLQSRVQSLEQAKAAPVSVAPEPSEPLSTASVLTNPKHPNTLTAYWDRGFHLADEEENFKLDIGGRIQFDSAWFKNSRDFDIIGAFYPDYGLGNEQDGVEFRRTRLAISGKAYGYMIFRAEYDFAANSPGDDSGKIREVWMGVEKIPYLGTLRAGSFKEPFSLEEITSDTAMPMMEKALPNILAPSFNVGLAFQNVYLNKRLNVSGGVFKTVDDWPSDNDSDEDQGYAISARLTGLPWYQPEKQRLLHLGLSYSHRNPDGPLRFRARPEANLANFYANTGIFQADDLDLYGLEAALVWGPLSLQAEYIEADTSTYLAGQRGFSGYYLTGSWFITGESRPYSTATAAFERVSPLQDFDPRGGAWGAWELAARLSALDLDDGPIRGGELRDMTLGMNWYPNPNLRLMLNYVHSEVNHDLYKGNVQALQTRFQLIF